MGGGGSAKLFGSLGAGGGGEKNLWFKGGAHKKNQDYHKYSGKICQIPPVDVYSAFEQKHYQHLY